MKVTIDTRALHSITDKLEGLDKLPEGILGYVNSEGAYGPRGQRYDHYVQGPKDQTPQHAATGWLVTDAAWNQRESEIMKMFDNEVKALIDGRRANWAAATKEAVELLYNDLTKYPPPPSGSTYVRTGTLRASWGWEVLV